MALPPCLVSPCFLSGTRSGRSSAATPLRCSGRPCYASCPAAPPPPPSSSGSGASTTLPPRILPPAKTGGRQLVSRSSRLGPRSGREAAGADRWQRPHRGGALRTSLTSSSTTSWWIPQRQEHRRQSLPPAAASPSSSRPPSASAPSPSSKATAAAAAAAPRGNSRQPERPWRWWQPSWSTASGHPSGTSSPGASAKT